MTVARKDLRPASRSQRPDTATHLFAVGQAVRLKGGFGQAAGVYYVTATLPPSGDSPQYRIRNDGDRHERVTTQDKLEAMRASSGGEGDTLIERTFSHG